jgi:hypothetical protein
MGRRLLAALIAAAALAAPAAAKADQLIYVRADQSSGITKAQLDSTIPAFQTMVTRDFAPRWGTDATLTTDPRLAGVADMQVNLLDYSPIDGALGFHEVFAGKPVSYVFVKESEHANEAWPLVFSHELQEMLADPWIDRVAQDPITGRMWAVEVSDAVESGYYAYWINGIPISDFVLPAWFGNGALGPYDFLKFLHRPHQVGRHGYAQWFDFTLMRWHVIWGFRTSRSRLNANELTFAY